LQVHTNRSIPLFFIIYKNEIFLALCWLAVHSFLLYQNGIQTGFEARKYIEEADNLLKNGQVSSPNFWLYSTQIFLLAAAKKIQVGFIPVMLVQWAFSLFAAFTLHTFIKRVSNKATAFVILLLFVFNIPLQTFDSFLQTESLFHSFAILFSCYLLSIQDLTWKNFLYVLLFLLMISFTRPTGLLWFPCAFIYLFFKFFRAYSLLLKISMTLAVVIGFLFFLDIAIGSGGEFDFMLPFRNENIICGVPTVASDIDIKISGNPNSLSGLAYYITHNTDQFTRLAWMRTKAFFGLQRTYYSHGHNIYLAICFYSLYILAASGLGLWVRRNKPLVLYCLSLIFLTWITVILSCDDWHNRFLLTVAPYLYILSIPAFMFILDKIKWRGAK
jgi:hypothetical protein